MNRWVIRLLRLAAVIVVILILSWYGLKLYFIHYSSIANQVRESVHHRLDDSGGQYLSYSAIPDMYRKAVIATEDRSYFTNIGINFVGIVRALYIDISREKLEQGGSTITQQLIHNTLLLYRQKSLSWKLRETYDAIGVFDTINKEETFSLYANVIYFGEGAYGLYSASLTYFGRPPSELNEGELTMLAGIPNSPNNYDPIKHYALARKRQEVVIQNLVEVHAISKTTAQHIYHESIRLKRPQH